MALIVDLRDSSAALNVLDPTRVSGTPMAIQIVLGMMMIIVTTIIQSGFTVVGIWALRQRVSKELTRSLWLST